MSQTPTPNAPNAASTNAARGGNPQAIALLINRSLASQGISAIVELKDGLLDVLLEAQTIPPEATALVIARGIQSLKPQGIHTLVVYGRRKGDLFSHWAKEFILIPQPPTELTPSGSYVFQLNGKTVALEQALGIAGCVLLLAGVFCPIINLPIVGSVSYFVGGKGEDAILLIVLSALSLAFILKDRYQWLWFSGAAALSLIATRLFLLANRLEQARFEMGQGLSDNPFRGLADAASASISLQWGWAVLIIGALALLGAAYQRLQKPNWKVYTTAGLVAATYLFLILGIPYLDSYGPNIPGTSFGGQATRAKESEAKQYTGSSNRAQQAFYLEHSRFAKVIDELGLGLRPETENYLYSIPIAEKSRAIFTATARQNGLRSFVGAVFEAETNGGEKTTVSILCATSGPSKTAPDVPTLDGNNPQCAPNSVKP